MVEKYPSLPKVTEYLFNGESLLNVLFKYSLNVCKKGLPGNV